MSDVTQAYLKSFNPKNLNQNKMIATTKQLNTFYILFTSIPAIVCENQLIRTLEKLLQIAR